MAISDITELTTGKFESVLDETGNDPKKIKKIIFCSGKVFYDLYDARQKASISDRVIIRIEELYPFPEDSIKAIQKKYPNATEQVWVQEEPQNQGAWMYIRDAFDEVTGKAGSIKYIGRKKSASPAAGHLKVHTKEQEELVKLALS
jgi:2-oxoglutarate dehydrogenase E1 component